MGGWGFAFPMNGFEKALSRSGDSTRLMNSQVVDQLRLLANQSQQALLPLVVTILADLDVVELLPATRSKLRSLGLAQFRRESSAILKALSHKAIAEIKASLLRVAQEERQRLARAASATLPLTVRATDLSPTERRQILKVELEGSTPEQHVLSAINQTLAAMARELRRQLAVTDSPITMVQESQGIIARHMATLSRSLVTTYQAASAAASRSAKQELTSQIMKAIRRRV